MVENEAVKDSLLFNHKLDLKSKFKLLVQSPLRSEILTHILNNPNRTFDVDELSRTLGRMRVDLENCLSSLMEFGLLNRIPTARGESGYQYFPPRDARLNKLIAEYITQQSSGLAKKSVSVAQKYFQGMIGRDKKMAVVFEMIRIVAKYDIPVLILGETGTGKELVARAIHDLSRRANHEFHAVNCAALPETLFESEIFGYEKGAFTDAQKRKLGRLDLADKGTLFLDEIGNISYQSQVKLLRVLEEQQFVRVGGNHPIKVDFRLVCASNQPLEAMVQEGSFRDDLFYRINVFPIRLPSLRERPMDIPIMAREFLKKFCQHAGMADNGKQFSEESLKILMKYEWPGNIRELENVISRVAMLSRDSTILPKDLKFLLRKMESTGALDSGDAHLSLREAERGHILRILQAANWNKQEAAKILDISRTTLYKKIKEYHLSQLS